MTRTAIAIRHLQFEDLGTLEPILKERGYAIRYVDATTQDLKNLDAQSADLMVVLGGPIGAYEENLYPFIRDELDIVHMRLAAKRPILGICLGAQLIARALGAQVYALSRKEIGFGPISLTTSGANSILAGLRETNVLHWHGDQFDIPVGAEHLAATSIGLNQAFSLGSTVLGLQFHLEVDARQIERWLVGHACELAQAGIDPRLLRKDAREAQAQMAAVSGEVFRAWLDSAGL